MLNLVLIRDAWETADFTRICKQVVQALPEQELPLQQALTRSSQVSRSPRNAVVLHTARNTEYLQLKVGVFYSGVVAGSCCSDDPTPLDEEPEYCELQFNIQPSDGMATVQLLA